MYRLTVFACSYWPEEWIQEQNHHPQSKDHSFARNLNTYLFPDTEGNLDHLLVLYHPYSRNVGISLRIAG